MSIWEYKNDAHCEGARFIRPVASANSSGKDSGLPYSEKPTWKRPAGPTLLPGDLLAEQKYNATMLMAVQELCALAMVLLDASE